MVPAVIATMDAACACAAASQPTTATKLAKDMQDPATEIFELKTIIRLYPIVSFFIVYSMFIHMFSSWKDIKTGYGTAGFQWFQIKNQFMIVPNKKAAEKSDSDPRHFFPFFCLAGHTVHIYLL